MRIKDSSSKEEKEEEPAKKLTVNVGSDHILGSSKTAPITLVEYGDYECPYTGMAYPIVKQLIKQFGNDKIYLAMTKYILYFATIS